MLDSDLAAIYGYTTSRFNEQVSNNNDRFQGEEFSFFLTKEEFTNLMSNKSISSWGGRRKMPRVFTESGVHMQNETKVQEALSHLLVGKTVLVIAHRMRSVEEADKIVVLADGRVVEEGTPSELMKKEDGVFRRMAMLQSSGMNWKL